MQRAGERSAVGNAAGLRRRRARGRGRLAAGPLIGALLGLALLGCEERAQDAASADDDPGSVVLARVGDDVIRAGDMGAGLSKDDAPRRLEALVSRKLAAEEARRRGLDSAPKLRAKLAESRRFATQQQEGLLQSALYNSLRLGLVFSEEELRAHYEKTKERFTQRQWKLRRQGFASQAEAAAADAALGAAGRLDPATSEAIGPLPAEKLPSELRPVVNVLRKPGQRKLVAHEGGWFLVELEEFLPAAQLSFEDAHDKVDQSLRAIRAGELFKAEIERLRAKEGVSIDEQALAKLTEPPADAAAPAAEP